MKENEAQESITLAAEPGRRNGWRLLLAWLVTIAAPALLMMGLFYLPPAEPGQADPACGVLQALTKFFAAVFALEAAVCCACRAVCCSEFRVRVTSMICAHS